MYRFAAGRRRRSRNSDRGRWFQGRNHRDCRPLSGKYPTIVKAIHQENKGHGGAVNTGVENATGLYFKVVDSDDWVNPEAYQKILNVLAEVVRGPKTLDLLISNYVYEKRAPRENV